MGDRPTAGVRKDRAENGAALGATNRDNDRRRYSNSDPRLVPSPKRHNRWTSISAISLYVGVATMIIGASALGFDIYWHNLPNPLPQNPAAAPQQLHAASVASLGEQAGNSNQRPDTGAAAARAPDAQRPPPTTPQDAAPPSDSGSQPGMDDRYPADQSALQDTRSASSPADEPATAPVPTDSAQPGTYESADAQAQAATTKLETMGEKVAYRVNDPVSLARLPLVHKWRVLLQEFPAVPVVLQPTEVCREDLSGGSVVDFYRWIFSKYECSEDEVEQAQARGRAKAEKIRDAFIMRGIDADRIQVNETVVTPNKVPGGQSDTFTIGNIQILVGTVPA